MSRTIWKYPFHVNDSVVIEMPIGAKIIPFVGGAMPYDDMLFIWAEVDPEAEREDRVLHVVGTGNPMPQRPMRHIGTCPNGRFVWHVYEAIQS